MPYVPLRKKGNTVIHMVGDQTLVRYHHTDIVSFNSETISLDSGGWFTQTTKERMNQVSREMGLGYTVYQEKFKWFVRIRKTVLEFQNGMVFDR